MAKFLPSIPRAALENAMKNVNIQSPKNAHLVTPTISNDSKILTIGNTKAPLYVTKAVTKVPDITFYDVPQHLQLLEHLLQVFYI